MSNNVVKEKERTIGNYNLGKTIGEGTFGKVRLGVHQSTGEKVAIKILEKDKILEQADIERVAKEIQILKMLRHQHIIQLYEIIETPKELFLIMEYANGGELFDYIVTNTKIKEKEACKFFQSIIAGVEYIHKIGVVHRDLKPENLLLDSQQNIKIVDFGLSNTYRSAELLKTACGSPCYAAPEMIAGKKYQGLLVDIWSCGIIMFAMICGYLPFEDPNTAQLYKKIIAGEFQIPSFISEDAKDLLCRVLNTDPNKRYTIKEIRAHPWYKQLQPPNQLDDSKGIIVGVDPIRLDEQLIEQLKHLHNVDPVQCRKMVSNNRHNNITTLYYLIQQRNRRQGRNYTTPEIKVQEITKLTMDDSIETNQMPQAQQGVQQKQKQVDTWQDALLTLESPINKTADYFKQIITKNFRDQYKLESPTIKQTPPEESSKIKVNPLYQHLQREILVKPKVHIPQMKLQFNPITQAVNNSISSVGTNTTTTPLATARKFKEEHFIDDRKHPFTDRANIDKLKLIDDGVNKQNYSILDISNKYLRNDKIKTEHNTETYSMKSVSQHQELLVHGEIAKKNYQIPMLKMNQQQQNNNANKTQPSQFKTINMSYYVQNRANDNNFDSPIQGNQTNRQSLLSQNDGKGQHQQQTSQIINRIKVTSSQHKTDTHSTHQAVKAVEPSKVHKGAFNLQCISSKQPKQLLDDLMAALDKFRISFDQKSRSELQCQSKESTKFEMGVYQLNKCEGVHLIKGRFLDGDQILYQMYSQNIIQSMNL